ncbi:MAG: hypothetical protein JWQ90_1893 [Hydrocarboniphaga sp.]|uniref:CRISPR-associated helicase Cas3' n=1 Tax=Hydrocarboniphaga sp. TaxID=2033016 RepID=UPI002639205C|nr:CRISPR-associated helicase Cas3' [Hydrocarboniphaga sp.]MDB5969443.1 hypothetical protein [Hydrocarboniphaga sp.]
MASYWEYWGKARPEAGALAWHPLPCHCLDVAAVGKTFLLQAHELRDFWASRLGLSGEAFVDACTFFLTMHDLGKFSPAFQAQRADLLAQLQGGRTMLKPYGPYFHDSLGAVLVGDWEFCASVPWLDALLSGADFEAGQCWFHAVTGHHGQPPRVDTHLAAHFYPPDILAAREFVDDAGSLLWPASSRDAWAASLPGIRLDDHRRFSWWLAGLAVLSDWLGSNTEYFPYCAPSDALELYWRKAQLQAVRALENSGVLPRAVAEEQAFGALFPRIRDSGTPLQQNCARIALAKAPQLFVLEDVTGAGKTEAAVMLAHRLLSAGRGQGLYFALPTMATANQMYERIGAVYDQLFATGSQPSLVLAHGARDLSAAFRASVLPEGVAEPEYEKDETASQRCTVWLADTRKAALLAQVGVGTIDQALMAVLPVKHQSLRLLGLFGKVLIVDEVHACDSYIFGLLKELLRFHCEAGGSAILLSATLPQQMRRELCAIYAPRHAPVSVSYPLLTHAHAEALTEQEVATRPQVARRVEVQWLRSSADCERSVLDAARQGKAVCWIRNTVAQAIASYSTLRAQHPETQLFHARFALGDRLRIEGEALHRFGRTGSDRAGQVLVATQVVEQSLDLDFDLMISDVAPIDLLVQRAGRVHRHDRGERGMPTLLVHAPQALPDADARWLGSELRNSGYVYPDLARLWLTVDELSRRGGWRMPEDARELIESVYGPDAEDRLPEGLRGVLDAQAGNRQAAKSLALTNTLSLPTGYAYGSAPLSNWLSEAYTPTRLGEPTATLHLLKWAEGCLTDFCPDPDPRRAAGLSRLSVRAAQVNEAAEPANPALAAQLQAWRERMGRGAKWVVPVPMCWSGGQWTGKAQWKGEQGAIATRYLSYTDDAGLEIVRKKS